MLPSSSFIRSTTLTLILVSGACSQGANNPATSNSDEWPLYRGNIAGTGYSSLDQITADNVNDLQVAWTYSLRNDAVETPRDPNSQVTPIVVDGVMYLPTVDRVL